MKRKYIYYMILFFAAHIISGCNWVREQLVPTSYIKSKIDPDFVRTSYFIGKTCLGTNPADQMVLVGNICVDRYEASLWTALKDGKQIMNPKTACNINGSDCIGKIFALSINHVSPSSNITWFQASAACASSGKRLLTNSEWQAAALGTNDNSTNCNISGSAASITGKNQCVSSTGIENMIGSLSEWVADWSQSNSRNDGGEFSRAEFGEDKVAGIDEASPESFRLPAAFLRGGSFEDKKGAGMFTIDVQNAPVRARETIGFRCAR
ncbi:SUMF1/EgtB/PvdO family nonheme iron enzyme [Citrobacter portucalensis]|uniref:SUMF1/EgtB/PvdO family nonheme iron enzyme n=1 Tax=Citrobacter portucalensis TaxID=1639133 RepID=UPI0009BFFD17|nr:SUMF1/EgtB/PvdO family nonheme iron enzyme [Citrobacter portucalensis]